VAEVISGFALAELGEEWRLRDGDCFHWMAIHPTLAADEQMFAMVKRESRERVVEYVRENVDRSVTDEAVQTYYFSPTYLLGVIMRGSRFFEPPPTYGEICAAWRKP
jgi:hypothetical protein